MPSRSRTQVTGRISWVTPCILHYKYNKDKFLISELTCLKRGKRQKNTTLWVLKFPRVTADGPGDIGDQRSLCVVNDQPVGNPKRKVWWVQQLVFPQFRNQGMSSLERRDKRLKVMLAGLRRLWTIYIWRIGQALLASCNAEPTHNTTKYFAPNLRWGCQSHRFAWNKGYERIEWKIVKYASK
jgi:hypothetical protein